MTISVLLVDDNIVFRESVRFFLQVTTEFRVIGEAGDGVDALLVSKSLRPDVLILDCAIHFKKGMELARLIRHQCVNTSVVMLSMHNDEAYVLGAIQNGASAYILKIDTVSHLPKAVISAADGKFYFSPSLRGLVSISGLVNQNEREKLLINS